MKFIKITSKDPDEPKRIIAIDFDDTIMDTKNVPEGKRMGEPTLGAKEAIHSLRDRGYKIIVHTVRGDSPQHIQDWCDYYGIQIDGITNIKPNADYYIDNKAIRFTDWAQTMESVKWTN